MAASDDQGADAEAGSYFKPPTNCSKLLPLWLKQFLKDLKG